MIGNKHAIAELEYEQWFICYHIYYYCTRSTTTGAMPSNFSLNLWKFGLILRTLDFQEFW